MDLDVALIRRCGYDRIEGWCRESAEDRSGSNLQFRAGLPSPLWMASRRISKKGNAGETLRAVAPGGWIRRISEWNVLPELAVASIARESPLWCEFTGTRLFTAAINSTRADFVDTRSYTRVHTSPQMCTWFFVYVRERTCRCTCTKWPMHDNSKRLSICPTRCLGRRYVSARSKPVADIFFARISGTRVPLQARHLPLSR